ncbi:MAG: fused MFS/spermidine synthase, partial [candidate division KSB1 bacterium]|nr:fused MFS/spermidine synthase [candidate division KSB1 bacterium]
MVDRVFTPTEKGILILFFLSGACGLIYETAWTRLLSQIYGSTVYAVSTILASFMAGLAIGSYYFGRLADVRKNPIKFYAFLELGIGIYALFSPLLLGNLNPLYIWVYHHVADFRVVYLLSLFAITFTLLLIPTIMMGGTLPVLSKFFINRQEVLGRKIGNLYSFNTFGAMFGCFTTGFLLIGTMGIKWTIYLAAFINIFIFIVLLAGSRYFPSVGKNDKREEGETKQIRGKWISDRTVLLILVAFSLSGFAALGYEVIWSRGLIFYLGNSTWAFTTMLTIFLGGLAFGSLLIR